MRIFLTPSNLWKWPLGKVHVCPFLTILLSYFKYTVWYIFVHFAMSIDLTYTLQSLYLFWDKEVVLVVYFAVSIPVLRWGSCTCRIFCSVYTCFEMRKLYLSYILQCSTGPTLSFLMRSRTLCLWSSSISGSTTGCRLDLALFPLCRT